MKEQTKVFSSLVFMYLAMYGGASLLLTLVSWGVWYWVNLPMTIQNWFAVYSSVLALLVVRNTNGESLVWKILEGTFTLVMLWGFWLFLWSPVLTHFKVKGR
jgi:hypothetical protein